MSPETLSSSKHAPRFAEALDFLSSRVNYEKIVSFTHRDLAGRLEQLRHVLTALGQPDKTYRIVHVAGTKGKGSTCAFLQSILCELNLKVGCFTSPHLDCVTERIAVNGVPCDPDVFAEKLFQLVSRVHELDAELAEEMTYFEWLALLAFVHFAQEKVDVAIFETGLGGRFDATNICSSDVAIVTSISYDHMEHLGPTLDEITAEKAGIIRQGVPVVSGVFMPGPLKVLKKMARSKQAPSYILGEHFSISPANIPDSSDSQDIDLHQKSFRFEAQVPFQSEPYHCGPLSLHLSGPHQRRNAALALMAAILLFSNDPKRLGNSDILCHALTKTLLPGRIEILSQKENEPIFIVDGAHNRASMRALIQTLQNSFAGRRLHLIFGVSMGKDVEGMLADIVRGFDHIVLTRHTTNPRAFPPQGLKTILSSVPDAPDRFREEFGGPSFLFPESGETLPLPSPPTIEVIEDCHQALATCWKEAKPGEVVCVSGSMFLAAELRRVFLNGQVQT